MTHIEWNGGLQIEVYKTTKLDKHYRCMQCKSTHVTAYALETGFGAWIKIKCHECRSKYISNNSDIGDFEEITADQVVASDINHKKIGRIKHPENDLAPIEYKDQVSARKFCKNNRCALCFGELTPKIIEPYDDYFLAHYNIECKEHGLLINGGAVNIWTIKDINNANDEREITDREPTKEEKAAIEKLNQMSDEEFLNLLSCNK